MQPGSIVLTHREIVCFTFSQELEGPFFQVLTSYLLIGGAAASFVLFWLAGESKRSTPPKRLPNAHPPPRRCYLNFPPPHTRLSHHTCDRVARVRAQVLHDTLQAPRETGCCPCRFATIAGSQPRACRARGCVHSCQLLIREQSHARAPCVCLSVCRAVLGCVCVYASYVHTRARLCDCVWV